MPLEWLKGPALAWAGEGGGWFIKGLCIFISKVFDLEGWVRVSL